MSPDPVHRSTSARIRICTGCSARSYPAIGQSCASASASMPACLPEQLLQRGVRLMPCRSDLLRDRGRERRVRPAGQRLLRRVPPSAACRPPPRGGTGSLECEAQASASSLGVEPEPVGGAVRHQRHRLERLRRGAPEGDQSRDRPSCATSRPVGIHHRHRDPVHRFRDAAAGRFQSERGEHGGAK